MKILDKRRRLLWIVLVGGAAVLVSYILGYIIHPDRANALWMPLTNSMIQHPNLYTWFVIRLVLALGGGASIGLLGCLLADKQVDRDWLYFTAVADCKFFCVQTAILDALVWPAYFFT